MSHTYLWIWAIGDIGKTILVHVQYRTVCNQLRGANFLINVRKLSIKRDLVLALEML